MLKNKKIVAVLVVAILGVGAALSMAKPKPPAVKQKIQGTIYVLPQNFLVNLNDGHFAKLTLALVLAPGQGDGAAAGASAPSGEGAGTLPEEAAIRDLVTNLMTNQSSGDLTSDAGRRALKHQILTSIRQQTDIKVEQVLLPDLTVQ